MTNLSPAALAVWDAFSSAPICAEVKLAAALRVAVNEMSRKYGYFLHHDFLRDIAAELEGFND